MPKSPKRPQREIVEDRGDKPLTWKDRIMKVGFYLPRDLAERLRDVAWFERTPASQIVRRLLQEYVDSRKRMPKRPKGEADQD